MVIFLLGFINIRFRLFKKRKQQLLFLSFYYIIHVYDIVVNCYTFLIVIKFLTAFINVKVFAIF